MENNRTNCTQMFSESGHTATAFAPKYLLDGADIRILSTALQWRRKRTKKIIRVFVKFGIWWTFVFPWRGDVKEKYFFQFNITALPSAGKVDDTAEPRE